jgi:asparagine synthase (glutamine-hydrolysing)
LASRANRSSLKTLTVVFEEHEFSEAQYARQVAECFHTEHSEVLVRSDDFMHELPGILEAMDQPTNDGVNTYFVSKAARQSGLTVVLSGLGADEVFWGYQHYRRIVGQSRSLRVLSQLPSAMRKAIFESASAYGRIRGRESWMRFAYLSRRISHGRLYLLVRGFFAPEQIAQLLSIERSELEVIVEKIAEMLQPPAADGATITDGLNYIEMKRYLHDQLLRDTDAFSMAHSIEVRVPYLDHIVVDLAANIPPEPKLNRAMNKPLLIRALGEPLLVEAGKRKKKGFVFPMTKWMKRHAEALEDIAVGADVLDQRAVRRLWKAFRAGRLHWSRAWALVVLGVVPP